MTGYRKVSVALGGIVAIGLVAWLDVPQGPDAIKAIAALAGGYLAINYAGKRPQGPA